MENNVQETIKRKRNRKYQAILEIVVAIALLVVVNIIANRVYSRIDFTKEKRYSLSKASKDLAAKLDDILYVQVYLEGELNPDFDRLRKATKEMLDEFKVASGGKIEYEFSNPLEGKTKKEVGDIIKQLQESGLEPTEIFEDAQDQNTRRIIVPGAMFYYKTTQQYPMNLLLKQQMGQDAQTVLNKSIEGLEYEIASTLRKVVTGERKKIAFLDGHGELGDKEVADVVQELMNTYNVERFNLLIDTSEAFLGQFAKEAEKMNPDSAEYFLINAVSKRLQSYAAIVIAKPTILFSEEEKFHLDQYVMNGGKIVWLIDPLVASLDSIDKYGTIMTADYDLGLSDMLFEYGARVNPDLIQDAECNKIPLGKPIKMYPWVYDPIIIAKSRHPIVKNLNPILMRFASSIDTVGKKSINKRVLLTSSLYSRVVNNPVELSFNIINHPPDPRLFVKSERPVAVLLSGEFQSLFRQRSRNRFDLGLKFKAQSPQNSMIVISDGDLIRNTVLSTGEMLPLGYDRFNRRFFDNKKFFVNCIDYMLDESGLIEVRTKEFEIRPLDMKKVKKEKQFWTTLNMAAPVVAIILFGLINGFIRRRRYVK